MKQTYYDFLKAEFEEYKGEYDAYLRYALDLFKLLCDILEEDIRPEDRQKVNAALSYFVSPLDVFPEDLHGPEGFTDDIYICAVVLLYIHKKYPEMLHRLWGQGKSLDELLPFIKETSEKRLKEWNLREKTIKYAGLDYLMPGLL